MPTNGLNPSTATNAATVSDPGVTSSPTVKPNASVPVGRAPPLSTAQPAVGTARHGGPGPGALADARRLPASGTISRAQPRIDVVRYDAAKFDRAKFYDRVRNDPFPRRLTADQVKGLEAILDKWHQASSAPAGPKDLRWLAYMLATTFHETAQHMQPIEEFGRGRGRPYGVPDPRTNKTYYGRGYVQLTWLTNYEKMSRLLGVDLVNHPELALKPDIAAAIMFEGMTNGASGRGDFTGKSLESYFTETKSDWKGARRIINGTDRAQLIASIAQEFYRDLIAAQS